MYTFAKTGHSYKNQENFQNKVKFIFDVYLSTKLSCTNIDTLSPAYKNINAHVCSYVCTYMHLS